MPRRTVVKIIVFLSVWLILTCYVGWTAWNALPAGYPSAAPGGPSAENDPALLIDSVAPGAVFQGQDTAALTVFGRGFDDATTLLVNGETATTARYLGPGMMYLELTGEMRGGARRLAISARSGVEPPEISNVAVVLVADPGRATVIWRVWIFGSRRIELTQETRFLLLTLLVGSLGGVLASFKSIADYRGEDRLFSSWTAHYFVSPFVAGFIALFLYFTIRAGFLSGTTVIIDDSAVPWGLLAIAALGGLFYDRSFNKLRELFLTLFRTDDRRSGKLDPKDEPDAEGSEEAEGDAEGEVEGAPPPPPVVTTTELPPATAGQPYQASLEARDASTDPSWSVTPELPGGLQLHPGTGVISGTPAEAAEKRAYVFTAETLEGGRASVSLELEVRP